VTRLDTEAMRRFLYAAGNRLEGAWLLIGGTLLPALGFTFRPTSDIDLVGLTFGQLEKNLELMKLADELGFPVETISQSAWFFVQKIPDWQNHLLPLHQGEKGTIYRPDLELFLRLKMKRLTEVDCLDCLAYIRHTLKNRDVFPREELMAVVEELQEDFEEGSPERGRARDILAEIRRTDRQV